MTRLQDGDRFTITLAGRVNRSFPGTSGDYLSVTFDDENLVSSHGFDRGFFEDRAEKVEPPAPNVFSFIESLTAGDRFTARNHRGESIWDVDYITYISTDYKSHAGIMVQGLRRRLDKAPTQLWLTTSDILEVVD